MIKIFKLVLLPFLFLVPFLSCSRHPGDVEGGPTASITYISPSSSLIYKSGDSIVVEAFIESSEVIHGYDLDIKKANDTTSYYKEHIHDHSKAIHAIHKWKNSVAVPADMEVIITATVDHNGNTFSRKAAFKVQ